MSAKFKLFKDSLFYHRSRSLERSCSSFTLAVHRGGKHGNYRLYSLPGQICIYKKYCPSSSIPATYLCNWFQIGPKIWPSIDIKHNFRCTWSLTTKHQLSKFPCIRHFSRLSIHFEWLISSMAKLKKLIWIKLSLHSRLTLKEAGGSKMTLWSGECLPFLIWSCYGHKNSWLYP